MKSKSFDLKKSPAEKEKRNKSFDFTGLYKTTAETSVKLLEKPKLVENLDKENSFENSGARKREGSPNKKKKKGRNEPLDISHINIDGHSLGASGNTSPVRDSRATSTPNAGRKPKSGQPKVKSIMKTSALSADDAMDGSVAETPTSKPKKRNKSVSFMLEDTEEIAVKKSKSNDSTKVDKKAEKLKSKDEKKKLKKLKKNLSEKENKSNVNMEAEPSMKLHTKKPKAKLLQKTTPDATGDSTSDAQPVLPDKKKMFKKLKKRKKSDESSEPTENDSNNNEESNEHKPKKLKKKNHAKSTTETPEGEQAKKFKIEVKPDIIAEDLENLSIGDNAHTLTNLLDEMTVVDKDKKKKNKLRRKKTKEQKTASVSSSETADLEKIEEGKEKVKWKKRKWNKDKKGDTGEDIMATSIIIDNLPLSIMCTYKKLLADHFGSCGLIKRVGIAEVYPTEQPKPVFTTTIVFYSEGAATKALEEDNTSLAGSRVRVSRPLPPALTTLVARSYAALTDQALSSVFSGAGRVRSIRHLVKGKKSMATAFVEFDGPEAVERAIKMAEDAKIGAKKIHVSRFELRGGKRKMQKQTQQESENEGDSEDSN